MQRNGPKNSDWHFARTGGGGIRHALPKKRGHGGCGQRGESWRWFKRFRGMPRSPTFNEVRNHAVVYVLFVRESVMNLLTSVTKDLGNQIDDTLFQRCQLPLV